MTGLDRTKPMAKLDFTRASEHKYTVDITTPDQTSLHRPNKAKPDRLYPTDLDANHADVSLRRSNELQAKGMGEGGKRTRREDAAEGEKNGGDKAGRREEQRGLEEKTIPIPMQLAE